MTIALNEVRGARALALCAAAAAIAGVAAITVTLDARALRENTLSGPVVPNLAARIGDAQKITIQSAEATYRIQHGQRGWAMRDRGDFPVNPARLAQLTHGLQDLRFVRRMTSDPQKHARLGVDDPRQGGQGVLVQIEDGRSAFLVNLILGVQPNGFYARRPDEDQVWAVDGELPPLRDASTWLDLRMLDFAPERVSRVEIVPSEGEPYILEREGPTNFRFEGRAARLQPLSPATLAGTAQRLIDAQPIDVAPAPAISAPPVARIRMRTSDGLLIDADLVRDDSGRWVKLIARADPPENAEAQAQADGLNARLGPWAYRVSETDFAALAPPVGTLTVQPQASPVTPAPLQP
ncbi:MAG: DUF4340 domain-containing protein [Alphaproteobacteria bacterium]|nr:DUF4340 domain-containing protein [Alphaproteobacteria bacterium]